MSTAAKLSISIAIACSLIIGVSWAVVARSSDAGLVPIVTALIRHFLSNNSLGNAAGYAVFFFIFVLMIFDYLSIICFRLGWDSANHEIDVYAAMEGHSGPKVTTRQKATMVYPGMLVFILTMLAVMIGHERDSIVKLIELVG